MKTLKVTAVRIGLILAMVLPFGRVQPAGAVPGDIIADVDATLAGAFGGVSVAFDGQFLYYTSFDSTVMHRIDVPPPGSSVATGHVTFPIVGAAAGINAFSWDATRLQFWGAGGDGQSIYLLTRPTTATPMSVATLQFLTTPAQRPGDCDNGFGCSPLIDGFAYDGTDDTI